MTEKKDIKIVCSHCGHIGFVSEKWKVFNSVICPKCLKQFALPWCREGFEPKGDIVIIGDKDTILDLIKDREEFF